MFRLADVPLSLISMPRIESGRVLLRAPAADDWPQWAEVSTASRAFLAPWEPTWPEDALTRDHFRRRLRHYMREWRAGEGYTFFVFLREGRRLAGGVSLGSALGVGGGAGAAPKASWARRRVACAAGAQSP